MDYDELLSFFSMLANFESRLTSPAPDQAASAPGIAARDRVLDNIRRSALTTMREELGRLAANGDNFLPVLSYLGFQKLDALPLNRYVELLRLLRYRKFFTQETG